MRLVIVNHEYPPVGGGGATACAHVARELSRCGHSVLVVTSAVSGYPAEESDGPLRIQRLAAPRRSRMAPRLYEVLGFCYSAARQLTPLAQAFRAEGLLAFFAIPAGFFAVRTARQLGLPVVVSLRGSDVPGFATSRLGPLLRYAVRPWVRQTLLAADVIAPNSRHLEELATRFEPRIRGKIRIVPNGCAPESIATEPAASRSGQLRLVTVSQLIARKRIPLAIEAVRGLDAARVAARLTVVGEGPEDAALRRLTQRLGVAERVSFTGHLPRREVSGILRQHDVFVMTSAAEGMCNAMLEAMAAGLPIVTARNGSEDVVRAAGCGEIVEATEAGPWVESLRRFSDDEPYRCRLAAAGLRFAKSYTWQSCARQFEALFAPAPATAAA